MAIGKLLVFFFVDLYNFFEAKHFGRAMAIEIFYLFVVIIYLFPSRVFLLLLPVTFNWFLCRAVSVVIVVGSFTFQLHCN